MRELLAEIAVGDLAPGDKLPREVDLVDRFGVSRGVIREGLRGLEERGVIAVKHGRGQTVRPVEDWDVLDPEVLAAVLDAPGGDALIAEALECQRLLEVEAAGLAAQRAEGEKLDALTDAHEQMSAAAARPVRTTAAAEQLHEADLGFHRAVMQASGNRALASMSVPLHRALLAATPARNGRTTLKRHVDEHARIASAIAAGDADAARAAMADHLEPPRSRRRGSSS